MVYIVLISTIYIFKNLLIKSAKITKLYVDSFQHWYTYLLKHNTIIHTHTKNHLSTRNRYHFETSKLCEGNDYLVTNHHSNIIAHSHTFPINKSKDKSVRGLGNKRKFSKSTIKIPFPGQFKATESFECGNSSDRVFLFCPSNSSFGTNPLLNRRDLFRGKKWRRGKISKQVGGFGSNESGSCL